MTVWRLIVLAGLVGALTVGPAAPTTAEENEAPASPAQAGLAVGNFYNCALTRAGALKCWGQNNATGALGLGDNLGRGDGPGEMGDALPAVDLGTGRRAVSLAVGQSHSCAILDDASLKCWGVTVGGQIGLGVQDTRGDGPGEMGDALPAVDLGTGRTATMVSVGGTHTCALLDDGTVKCWGDNLLGQEGQGDTTRRGDDPGEMGDDLPPVDLGTGHTATALVAGRSHTCALLDDGSVKCWGWNQYGQLGLGHIDNVGDGAGEMGDALPAVDLGTGRTAVALSAGFVNTCALLDDGSVKCWGFGGFAIPAQGNADTVGDGVGEMGDSLPAVDLGTGRTAVAISAGDSFACALLDNAQVKCWGKSDHGQLGLGDTATRGDEPGEMGDALPVVDLGTGRTAIAVAAGNSHACARLDDDTLRCWGNNQSGALGLGDTSPRGDGLGEMGDALPPVELGDPTVTITTPPDGATYARGQVVNASYSCADETGGSGIDTCVGDDADGSPIDTATLGAHTFSVTATDEAGNSRTVSHDYTVVDGTDPSVTITTPPDGATYAQGQVVNADFDCGDEPGGSGLDTCVGDVADGSPIDTATLGTHTFSVTATDEAGNTTTVTHDYTIVPATCFGEDVTVDLRYGEAPTAGDDVIFGTSESDVVFGLGGADLICGRSGEDDLRGGRGKDRISGGADADHLVAGRHGGLLGGNAGDDILIGGSGKDALRGGADDDDLTGGRDNDRVDGGLGEDTCDLAPGWDRTLNCEVVLT